MSDFNIKVTGDNALPFELTILAEPNQRIVLDLTIEDFTKLETALGRARKNILANALAKAAQGGE